MGKLYLHIGMGKTGTSAIQYFLFKNREYLKSRGIYFPAKDDYLDNAIDGTTSGNSEEIIKLILEERYEEVFEYFENLLQNNDVIISSEVLIYFFGKNIELLADIVETFDTKVILYIRKQDEFYNSLANQWTKFKYLEDVDCISEVHEHYFYIMKLMNHVNNDKIVMKVYEKGQFKNGNIFSDFLDCLGLELDENFELPEKRINTSLSPLAYEIKKIYNKRYSGVLNENLIKTLVEYSVLDRKSNDEKFFVISKTEREELLETYSVFNMGIATKFFGREDGKLFYDEISDTDVYSDSKEYTLKELDEAYEFMKKNHNSDNIEIIEDIIDELRDRWR